MHDYTAQILKTLRKFYGVNQRQMATIIGITQGTMSKLEAGQLGLSAIQWISLCSKYSLNPSIIETGRIEALSEIKIDINKNQAPEGFKVDKKFKFLMGSSVRTVYPFVKFMNCKIGVEKSNEFFKSIGIDPDYFVIQNLPINLKIIEEIFNYLIKKGLISMKNMEEILSVVPASEVHDYALSHLNFKNDPELNLKKFTKNISNLYEQNSIYEFVGDTNCYIKVRDNNHVSELSLNADFVKFRQGYNLTHFNKLSPILLSDHRFQTTQEDHGWNLKIA